ncbi:MAG: LysR family transcriptional regulator [Firmicutes bacterium]|nr:LysR family transcriptional regulator [Bacillota bacterium]
MNIKEYRYILEIARCGSISKAAAALHISQPSLSAYLKKVEDRLGASLFDITPGGICPTSLGTVYLEYANQIAGMDDKLMETLDSIQRQATGVVRVGITVTRSVSLVPIILSSCREEHPGIEVKIIEHNSATLEDMLINQRSVDIILLSESQNTSRLPHQLLSCEQVLLAVPRCFTEKLDPVNEAGHILPWVSLEQLRDIPFVLHKSGHRLRQISNRLFDEYGIYPNVLFETQNINTAFSVVKSGMAACFLYDSVLYGHSSFQEDVQLFRIGNQPIRIPVIAAYTEDSLRFPPVQAILDTIVRSIVNGYRLAGETTGYPEGQL